MNPCDKLPRSIAVVINSICCYLDYVGKPFMLVSSLVEAELCSSLLFVDLAAGLLLTPEACISTKSSSAIDQI